MARKAISEKVKDTIRKEFNYKCAICASDNPQIHHIDENHENNNIDNLLPLCPNCHLSDQHNPTRKIDIPKLQLFRKYKDPTILNSKFHPLYTRSLFLDAVEENTNDVKSLYEQTDSLIEFVKSLEMGTFYAQELEKLIKQNGHMYSISMSGGIDHRYEEAKSKNNLDDRKKLIINKKKVMDLIVELLRYQNW